MYNNKPTIVYGFHGIDEDAAIKILNQKDEFRHSDNAYDWLGSGVYFWENNLERARQYAIEDSARKNSKIKKPFVLGAVLELGNCLDLLDQKYLDILSIAYEEMKSDLLRRDKELPSNGEFHANDFDFKKRELDCSVIRYAHQLAEAEGEYFDSVRAAFWEGDKLYPEAGFRKKNHIQIAVLNPNCIKGIFLPREITEYPKS